MYSDNENPGTEISAGQSATAASPAPEPLTPAAAAQSEEPPPAAVEAQDTTLAAPVSSEPAAVTVTPVEPVAAPDSSLD